MLAMQSEWDAWNEWTPNQPKEGQVEESYLDIADQSNVPFVKQPSIIGQQQPNLLNVTPIQQASELLQDARNETTSYQRRTQDVCAKSVLTMAASKEKIDFMLKINRTSR